MKEPNITQQRSLQRLEPLHIADPYSQAGAAELAEMIRHYWLERGYRGVVTWVAPIKERKNLFAARSNIGPTGFPPKERALVAA
jgi:hypothetical protein